MPRRWSMERRDFLKKTVMGGAAAATAATVSAPTIWAQGKSFQWKMVTTWPPGLPILQTGAERFAKRVEELSEGRLKITVYAGGELVPPLNTFDAVSQGTVEAGSSAAYYWAGKTPASQWFCAVPFGLNAQGMYTWIVSGGGLKLWEETYAPFNVVPRPAGSTGVQMGGWFKKKIETMEDIKGLKFRIPGLGGKVYAKAGAAVVLLAGGEIYTALERGAIDGTEWVGPYHDLRMGFHQAAKYYYYPGWHEPGSLAEFIFNKKAYESLPTDLRAVVDAACNDTGIWMLSEFEFHNGAALRELVEKHKVEVLRFPESVLKTMKKLSAEALEEEASKDPMAKKVHEAFKSFQKSYGEWSEVAERSYHNFIAGLSL
jgi:TRAP-type mannitol/chloroaromatic compound transport system substrate-binding protein